jgi:hypothetical protein
MKNALQETLEWIVSLIQAFSEKQLNKAWWVRVKTERPEFTYYFGPFENRTLAQEKLPGFVEDLQIEQAEVSSATVEWCSPPQLTIQGNHQPA